MKGLEAKEKNTERHERVTLSAKPPFQQTLKPTKPMKGQQAMKSQYYAPKIEKPKNAPRVDAGTRETIFTEVYLELEAPLEQTDTRTPIQRMHEQIAQGDHYRENQRPADEYEALVSAIASAVERLVELRKSGMLNVLPKSKGG